MPASLVANCEHTGLIFRVEADVAVDVAAGLSVYGFVFVCLKGVDRHGTHSKPPRGKDGEQNTHTHTHSIYNLHFIHANPYEQTVLFLRSQWLFPNEMTGFFFLLLSFGTGTRMGVSVDERKKQDRFVIIFFE